MTQLSTSPLKVVHLEEMYEILLKKHTESNKHGSRSKLYERVKKEYYNITKECSDIFYNLCEECKTDKNQNEAIASETFKPKLPVKKLNGRAWVCFMEQPTHQNFNFIMIYRECSTHFSHIRAIHDKSSRTVAIALFEILTSFGSPLIMYLEGSRDFGEEIISQLSDVFPYKIVLGSNRNFSDEIEEAKIKVRITLQQMSTLPWPIAVKLVQCELNQGEFVPNVTPYEAMFGVKINQNGAAQIAIPADLLIEIYESEDCE